MAMFVQRVHGIAWILAAMVSLASLVLLGFFPSISMTLETPSAKVLQEESLSADILWSEILANKHGPSKSKLQFHMERKTNRWRFFNLRPFAVFCADLRPFCGFFASRLVLVFSKKNSKVALAAVCISNLLIQSCALFFWHQSLR